MPRFFLFAACLLAAARAAADEAASWLERMADAERRQSFEGVFVYERNGSFSTHGIWRAVGSDGGRQERLLQLDGAEHEVLLVDGQVRCASGGLTEPRVAAQTWPARQLQPQRLKASYELRLLGPSRVAGRAAMGLVFLPRDPHRYGRELHLDAETGLPLKSLLLGEQGQLLERFQYTRLQPEARLQPQALQPQAACRAVPAAPSAATVAPAWQLDWIPPGFALQAVLERPGAQAGVPLQSLVYEDGLTRFSVFVEALGGARVDDGRSQVGPTVVVSRRLSSVEGGVMVTVVGEIPPGTAERVALSMRPVAGVAP